MSKARFIFVVVVFCFFVTSGAQATRRAKIIITDQQNFISITQTLGKKQIACHENKRGKLTPGVIKQRGEKTIWLNLRKRLTRLKSSQNVADGERKYRRLKRKIRQFRKECRRVRDGGDPTPTPSSSTTPTFSPTASPTYSPTASPTSEPTVSPTSTPTASPTDIPTSYPTSSPTETPTSSPSQSPTAAPTSTPTSTPTDTPTVTPTATPDPGAIYVDLSIGSTSCTTYNPGTRSCSSGSDTAYRTFAGAAAVTVPGTVVLIRGGTYNAQLRPQNSGTAGNYISFKGYPGETVYFAASTGILLSDRSYINIERINVEDTRWVEALNAHHNIIQNCIFKRTPASGTTGNIRFISSNYNRVLNNIIEDGNDNLLFIDSNYNLAEGNTIKEGRHSIFGIRCGDYNIIRNNYFSNTQQKIGEVYDCGEDTHPVPHSFNSTSHNVIENNVFADCTTYYSTSGGNGIQYSGQQGIIRNNAFYDCNVGLAMQVYSDEALYNTDNRVYHNVFYNNDCAGLSVRSSNDGNHYKNNILAGNLGCLSDCFSDSPGQLTYRGSLGANAVFENNAIFYRQPGQAVIEQEFGSGQTVSAFNAANGGILANTVEADPLFTNAGAHDFSLQSGSTLRNAGTFLTRTSSSGSGTTMTVNDAFYLYDGYGIPWEQGDLIQLEGQTTTARIISINYNTNVITLDRSLTWSSGQGITLQFAGSAPDIGLYN